MSEEKKNGVVIKDEHNEFELALRLSMIDNNFCALTSASKRIVSDTNPKDMNLN